MDNESKTVKIIAKTFAGLEEALSIELKELGCTFVRTLTRGVECRGNKKILYQANYQCRSALRIIVPVAEFIAENEQQLYDEVKAIDWFSFLDINSTFSIDGITSYSNISHSKYLALKTKDAIADKFREKFGKRPNVDKDNADLRINVRVFRNRVTVSLDSSGESLHKRGYRVATGPAPLNEVLAAGMLLIAGWKGDCNFIDPMCGSGTIPIEAALIALNIPSGKFREDYAFMHWPDFDKDLWEQVKEEAEENKRKFEHQIVGSDWSGRILLTAKENVVSAGVEDVVNLNTDFIRDVKPPEGKGIMVCNPPYGERIKNNDIKNLYKGIGDAMKQNFVGYNAWIISSNLEAFKHIGLQPVQKINLFNGPLECKYGRFEIFEGSKKDNTESIKDNLSKISGISRNVNTSSEKKRKRIIQKPDPNIKTPVKRTREI